VSSCLRFTGEGSFGNVEEYFDFDRDASHAFTVEAWVYLPPPRKGGGKGNEPDVAVRGTLIDKHSATSPEETNYALVVGGPAAIDNGLGSQLGLARRVAPRGQPVGEVPGTVWGDTALCGGSWHHVAASYNGKGALQFVVDGETDGRKQWTPGGVTPGALFLGRDGSGHWFNGMMDDVRIWNVSRSVEDIQNNMMCGLYGNETGLLAYWRMDEAKGNVARDATTCGLPNDAMLFGTQWESKCAPLGERVCHGDACACRMSFIDFEPTCQSNRTLSCWFVCVVCVCVCVCVTVYVLRGGGHRVCVWCARVFCFLFVCFFIF